MNEENNNHRNNLKERLDKKFKYLEENLYLQMLENIIKAKEKVEEKSIKNDSSELNKKLKKSRSLL